MGGVGGRSPPAKARCERARQRYLRTSEAKCVASSLPKREALPRATESPQHTTPTMILKPHALPPLVLFGPTASGKSRLALALARKLAPNTTTHIVNCDSLQLYTHLPILTAQPTPADKAETPHHLYAIAKPAERLSAGLYAEKATALLQHLQSKHPNDAVILCGGSGLYLRATLGGLTALPQPSRDAIQKVRQWQKEKLNLYELLQQRDPATAATLLPQDTHRIVRALEFFETCGTSLLKARKGIKQASSLIQPWLMTLTPCRKILYEAINARFERMLKQGAIEEVRALNADPSLPCESLCDIPHDIPQDSPWRGALGLREIEAYCKGELSWQAMVEQGQQRVRNYAKRQITWIRHQLSCEPQCQLSESVAEDLDGACQKVAQAWSKASCTSTPFV